MSYRDLIYNEFMRSPFCNVAMLTVQVKIDCCHGSQWQPHAKILAKIRPIPLPPICQAGGGQTLFLHLRWTSEESSVGENIDIKGGPQ